MDSGNRAGDPHLASQAFFIEGDNGILWRLDIVYRNKIVMITQNSNPVEVYPGFDDCRYAVFSADGRYVLVGAEIGTEDAPECAYALIDMEEASVTRLQRTSDVACEPVFWISTEGSLAMLAHGRIRLRQPFTQELAMTPDTLFFYNSELTQTGIYVSPSSSPLAVRSDDGSVMVLSEREHLVGLDSSGREIWRTENITSNDEDSQFYGIRLSSDGKILLNSISNGVYAIDAHTGYHLCAMVDFTMNTSLAIAGDGSCWAGTFNVRTGQDQRDYYFKEYIVTYSLDKNTLSIDEATTSNSGASFVVGPIMHVFDNGMKLLFNRSEIDRMDHFLYLLGGNGQIYWRSADFKYSVQFSGNVSPRWWTDSAPNSACWIQEGKYAVAFTAGSDFIVKLISCNI